MNTETSPVNPVKVGDIFCMSWGYDQTNVDYFQVVRITAKSAEVREIAYEEVPGTNHGGMACKVRPKPGIFLPTSQWVGNGNLGRLCRVKMCGGTPYIGVGRHYSARRVSADSTTYNSWYA